MSDYLDTLMPAEREIILNELLSKPLKNKEDLRRYLLYFYDVDLADCTVSRFSNSNPLDMVWELYEFCLRENNDEPKTLMYIAGRSSQKTLSCSVIHILLPTHLGRSVIHFGGTERQSSRAFNYDKSILNRPLMKNRLVGTPTMIKTQLKHQEELIDLEVNALTEATVQGGHANVLSLDELSSLASNKLAAYPDLNGIPIFTKDGKPWLRFGISSRKGRATIIEREYENRHKTGVEFRFWTVLENTQRCPDSISGTKDLEMYVNVFENKTLLIDDYNKLNEQDKTKFERVIAKENCYSCPLSSICAGDAKKQTSKCRTLRPIKSLIKEFKNADLEWFLSQAMSLTPSSEDMVYPKFKREVFEKTPREMFTIFTGRDPGAEISEEDLIREMIKSNIKRYAGVDHGYTHPFSIVVVFEDSAGNAYIMHVHEESGLEPQECVEIIRKLKARYHFTHLYPDTASPAINKMISKIVTVVDDFTKNPGDGIALIRHKMCPNVGGTKLFGLKGYVDSLIENFEKYHFQLDTAGKLTDKPVKEYDDSHDALSYAAQNRWNKGKPIVASNQAEDPLADPNRPKETQKEYNQKIQKQYDNWLTQQIGQEQKIQGGNGGVQSSQSKGFFWQID